MEEAIALRERSAALRVEPPTAERPGRLRSEGSPVSQRVVFPLWMVTAQEAAQRFREMRQASGGATFQGVAVLAQGDAFQYGELAELEAAGLMVVEVPTSFRDRTVQQVAEFLYREIQRLESHAVGGADDFGADPDPADYGPPDLNSLPAAEQREWLARANNRTGAIDALS